MINKAIIKVTNSKLSSKWTWQCFEDGSGSLEYNPGEEKDIDSYFQYDMYSYINEDGIEYKITKNEQWSVFWGNFEEFKKFAEEWIVNNVVQ